MIVIRRDGPDEWYLSYGYSDYLEYFPAADALYAAGIIPDGQYAFPASRLESAIAVIRLKGIEVEVRS